MAESSTLASTAAAAPEEQKGGDNEEMMHKTKVIQFLGRTTPIILQNDNGPCPLLAICKFLYLDYIYIYFIVFVFFGLILLPLFTEGFRLYIFL